MMARSAAFRLALLAALLPLGLAESACSSSSPSPGSDAGRRDANTGDGRAADGHAHDAGAADSRHDAPGDASRLEAGQDAGQDAHVVDAGLGHANGTLGTWQTIAPMPLPRANHCAVAAAGYLVVIGGNYEPAGTVLNIDEVDVTPLHADGSIGAWTKAGTTPSPVSECTAAASGNTIYLIDGIYDDMADQGHAFSAVLSGAGVLGPWTALGANGGLLPNSLDAFSTDAWVANDTAGTLYVMATSLTLTAALRSPTSPAFTSWSEDDWLPGFLGRPEYAFTGSYVYAIGGYLSTDAGNPVVLTVTGAPIEAGGKVGASFVTQALPMPVIFGRAIAVDDWIFVVGGKPDIFTPGVAGTLSAQVGALGELGPWTAQTLLPEGRTDMALTLAGNFLYQTGGGFMGPGVPTVFATRVRF